MPEIYKLNFCIIIFTYYLLPITYYLLPITYYLLPITYYLLPITHLPLISSAPKHSSITLMIQRSE
ncbi:hypothetical protein ATS72_012660 [Pseudoalteromonas sp. 13-15]|nr:hypothetical protein ATS72_012660 [Pseudoalteromonas sp. 13-15]